MTGAKVTNDRLDKAPQEREYKVDWDGRGVWVAPVRATEEVTPNNARNNKWDSGDTGRQVAYCPRGSGGLVGLLETRVQENSSAPDQVETHR